LYKAAYSYFTNSFNILVRLSMIKVCLNGLYNGRAGEITAHNFEVSAYVKQGACPKSAKWR